MTNLILLHGALGCKKQLATLKDILSATHNVLDMDFDGHGNKSMGAEFSISWFSRNVLEMMNENQIEKADFFGYSMGGYVALNFAKDHPGRVGRIITLGTKFDWSIEAAEKEVKMLIPEKMEEKIPQFVAYLKKLHAATNWKLLVNKTADLMLGLANGEKLRDEHFNQIPHNVLICLGSLDRMVSKEESEHAAKVIPNATFRLIEDFQHPIEKVDFDKWSEEIKTFTLE